MTASSATCQLTDTFALSIVQSDQSIGNISTRRAIVDCGRDPEEYTNGSLQGKRQRGEGPRIFILMDINNL